MTTINEKQFNTTLKAIKTNADNLAQSIHEAGVFAIEQANLHGNDGFAQRLVEAMGRKHDVKRVEKWLMKFGKLGIRKGIMVYRKRLDITHENAMSFVAQAEAMPYWDLTKQSHATMTVDWLNLLQGFLKRDETISNNIKEGKEVTVLHPEVLAEVKALLVKIGNGKVLTNIDNNVVTL